MAIPQARCVYLVECGTHIIFDAGIWRYADSEKVVARRLLRSVSAEMLVMLDMGLTSMETLFASGERGADFLARVESRWRLDPVVSLEAGSYLADLFYPDAPPARSKQLRVRGVVYTLDAPDRPGHGQSHRLLTSLLDPTVTPALDLVCTYHERWEIESTLDELDTHQRLSPKPFRSHSPVGVSQEIYALFIAHFVGRCWMRQTAHSLALDPDRLSFIHCLRVLRDSLPLPHLNLPFPFSTILCDTLASWVLPLRDNRITPRVLKRRLSKFQRKRPSDRHPPQPTKLFREAIRLCSP